MWGLGIYWEMHVLDSVYQMKRFVMCDRIADTGIYIMVELGETKGGEEHI